jgi:hypothetical protein
MAMVEQGDLLAHYINRATPLGPLDTDLIRHSDVERKLFDPHYTSFDRLLSKDLNVITGRRGSGKTALLNCYKLRRSLNGGSIAKQHAATFDLWDYESVFSTPTHTAFEALQLDVMGASGGHRPIESVVADWEQLIGDYLLTQIANRFSALNNHDLGVIHAYLARPETLQRLEANEAVWGVRTLQRASIWPFFKKKAAADAELPSRSDALSAANKLLRSANHRALFLLDSMDEYQVGDRTADRTVGALIRFVRQFNADYGQMAVKIGLPSEIFPEIQRACANPLKDMVRFDHITWTSIELARIAAHRYRLFLQLHDRDGYARYSSLDFNRRGVVRQFWSGMFDAEVRNEYGEAEHPLTYILRHTQLLPRQLIAILEYVVKESHARTGGYWELKGELVEEAIAKNETVLVTEIFSAYRYVFPDAERVCRALLGNFPTVFSYDELENKWRQARRPVYSMEHLGNIDFVSITDMLLRIGVIGVVEKAPTGKYVEGVFSYNLLVPPNIGQGHGLCVHPIFSRHFRCAPCKHNKAVLPYGVAFE